MTPLPEASERDHRPRPPIGFIGLGAMGGPMATRLLAAGPPVVVYDTDPARVATLVQRGAQPALSVRDVAQRAETVFVCLPTPDIVRQVALGEEGIASGDAEHDRPARFVDLSTTGPDIAIAVANGLAARGITAIDMPVTGGVPRAEAGTLTLIGAGPCEAMAAIAPAAACLGTLHHVSEAPGAGQLLKLINNLLSSAALLISCEGLALGVKGGLDLDAMLAVINSGSGRNSATLEKFPQSIAPGLFTGGIAIELAFKDVRLCLEQAERHGVPMRLGGAVRT